MNETSWNVCIQSFLFCVFVILQHDTLTWNQSASPCVVKCVSMLVDLMLSSCLPAALRAAQICRYLVYSEADFEVFAPQGRHVAPMGVKFGMEEGTFGPLLLAKFHPHRCNDKGVGPQNWNFYSDLTEIWNINAPQGRIPCAIFIKFAEFLPHFRCVGC